MSLCLTATGLSIMNTDRTWFGGSLLPKVQTFRLTQRVGDAPYTLIVGLVPTRSGCLVALDCGATSIGMTRRLLHSWRRITKNPGGQFALKTMAKEVGPVHKSSSS